LTWSSDAKAKHVPGGANVFQRMFTRLACPGRPPHFVVEFYPYCNLTHSIRLREETAYVRLSDLLCDAPLEMLEAAAAILLTRLYRRRAPRSVMETYQRFAHERGTRRRLLALRRKRARLRISHPRGRHHDLEPLFEELNRKYFEANLPRPRIGWSTRRWRGQLGTFDPALMQIAVNCALDRPGVPEYVIQYVLYHEMLHQKHPMKLARCRLESHSRKFREEEKKFVDYERAVKYLERFV